MSNGGASFRGLSQTSRIGPALVPRTRAGTFLVCIFGVLVALVSLQCCIMEQSTLENGSLHRKLADTRYRSRLMIHSTIEYVAQQLIHGYKSGDNVTQAFLDNYDFYIFPFVNPDGM
jgi:hypothetical protein